MLDYIILGTSHDWQDTSHIMPYLQGITDRYAIRLIAEEHPLDCHSAAFNRSVHLHIPYLQIDMFDDEKVKVGISQEQSRRPRFERRGGALVCYRLSRSDEIREDFWLQKVEASVSSGRVLLICGFHHANFLVEKIAARGCHVTEEIFFPPELSQGVEIRALSPAELDEYCKEHSGSSR
jgi:hypothetical protein